MCQSLPPLGGATVRISNLQTALIRKNIPRSVQPYDTSLAPSYLLLSSRTALLSRYDRVDYYRVMVALQRCWSDRGRCALSPSKARLYSLRFCHPGNAMNVSAKMLNTYHKNLSGINFAPLVLYLASVDSSISKSDSGIR
jgi:hypothetical protein